MIGLMFIKKPNKVQTNGDLNLSIKSNIFGINLKENKRIFVYLFKTNFIYVQIFNINY